ncbi:MAG: chemotaxis protein CheW [Cyanobacteria bacterium P01_F01_bin.143]
MESQSYLRFRLHDLDYAIKANQVKEIFQLPEINPIADAPGDIIGILNLRDKILPIMHLDRRLGQPVQECRAADSVIVIEWERIQIGIIVNEVLEVQVIESSKIETEPDYGRENYISSALVMAVAKVADRLIMILQAESLIRQADEVAMMVWEEESKALEQAEVDEDEAEEIDPGKILTNFYDLYCPNAQDSERKIFRKRASELKKPLETFEVLNTMPLAIFSLGDEYFAFDLEVVKEFIDIDNITPIPCCPKHILGNLNLRGEIITLIDVAAQLNLPKTKQTETSQAIIIQTEDISVGIMVDEVFDVIYLAPELMNVAPTAIHPERRQFIRGTASYGESMFSAIDLSKIFTQGNLVVDH